MKKYFKFAWFLLWFTLYAIVAGIRVGALMWWDDVKFEWRKTT